MGTEAETAAAAVIGAVELLAVLLRRFSPLSPAIAAQATRKSPQLPVILRAWRWRGGMTIRGDNSVKFACCDGRSPCSLALSSLFRVAGIAASPCY
jgi:hypothetical protein